jgi:putative spermidine/putrescine transport system permease protein
MSFVEETRSSQRRFLAVALGAIGLLYMLLFVLPMLYMVAVSYGSVTLGAPQDLDHWYSSYTRFWGSAYYRDIMFTSLKLAFWTMVATLAFGLPLAYVASRGSKVVRVLALIAVINPLFVSTIVRAFGLNILLTEMHLDRTFTAVLIGCVQVTLPFMVVPLMSGFRDIDPLTIHSARTLGAGRLRIAFRIALPILAPSLLAGGVLVFVLTMNIFSIPLILGKPERPTMALVVYQSALAHADFVFAAAVAMIMLVLAITIIAIQGRVARGGARSVVI